jgi:hypothetical protein
MPLSLPEQEKNPSKKEFCGKYLKRGMNMRKCMHTIIIPGFYSGMELAPLIVQ